MTPHNGPAVGYVARIDADADADIVKLEREAAGRAARRIRPTPSIAKIPGDTGDTGDAGDNQGNQRGLAVPTAELVSGDNGDKSQAPGPRARFERIEYRAGFRPGIYWIGTKTDDATGAETDLAPIWICSPLTIAAMTRDANNSAWGRLLVFRDADHIEHRWAMPMTMMAGMGDELRARLLEQGLEIASDPVRRRRLAEYIQWERPDVSARCVTRTGWYGPAFVLPTQSFGDTEAEPILFQTTAPDSIALSIAGTLNGWRDSVSAPCAGNSRLVLALSCAFAGPCLGLLSMDGGGIHFRGGSSGGKSTALAVAASLFGAPAYARTWRQTDNALEGIASLHSDLLLILDEIGQLDPKHAGAVAYLLANGQGKGRANRDGAPRAAAAFRVLFLSAGEIGLADLVTAGGGKVRAGQEVRVIDLPADAGTGLGMFEIVPDGIAPAAFADRLKSAASTHYGHALQAFLPILTTDPDKLRHALRESRDALAAQLAGADAAGQVTRVAHRFALIAAAGELATAHGLTGWPAGEAERAATACFAAWITARGTRGAAEPAAMIAQTRAFLESHGDSRFSPWVPDDRDRPTINRAGFRRKTEAGPEFYILPEAFKREVCIGFDPGQVARALRDKGALMTEGPARLTRKERLPDGSTVRVYRVTPALWEGDT